MSRRSAWARLEWTIATSSLVLTAACGREAPPTVTPTVEQDPPPPATAEPIATSAPPPLATASADAAAPEPAPPPPPASCEDALPPDDIFAGNFSTTSVSGLAEVVSSSKTGPGGSMPAPTSGYVNFRYDVRVVEWFAGKGAERMVLSQQAEAQLDPKPAGTLLLFSACASKDDAGYEPDVGYFFPVHPDCRASISARAAAAAKRAKVSTKGGLRKNAKACRR